MKKLIFATIVAIMLLLLGACGSPKLIPKGATPVIVRGDDYILLSGESPYAGDSVVAHGTYYYRGTNGMVTYYYPNEKIVAPEQALGVHDAVLVYYSENKKSYSCHFIDRKGKLYHSIYWVRELGGLLPHAKRVEEILQKHPHRWVIVKYKK